MVLKYKSKNGCHGMTGTKIYCVYGSMIQRCHNPNNNEYDDYGGRGITVCDRWTESFANFFEDMAATYSEGLYLDRINNNGSYEPSNCRWIARSISSHNQRKRKGCSSQYIGVSWEKRKKKWSAKITINYKQSHLGYFESEIDAARAYDEKTKELFGPAARTNF